MKMINKMMVIHDKEMKVVSYRKSIGSMILVTLSKDAMIIQWDHRCLSVIICVCK